MKLIICGTVLTIFISIAEALIIAIVGDSFGAGWAVSAALIPAAIHVCAMYKRFRKRHDISASKFVTASSLPSLIIGAVFSVIFFFLCVINGIGISDYDCTELHGVYVSLCVIGCSAVYAALLSAVMGIAYAVDKKRKAQSTEVRRRI